MEDGCSGTGFFLVVYACIGEELVRVVWVLLFDCCVACHVVPVEHVVGVEGGDLVLRGGGHVVEGLGN